MKKEYGDPAKYAYFWFSPISDASPGETQKKPEPEPKSYLLTFWFPFFVACLAVATFGVPGCQ